MSIDVLTQAQVDGLAATMSQRKLRLNEEIREGLAGIGHERHADALSGTTDASDESVANLMRDIAHAEVARDVGELRDIVAAERRIASGRYGICIDCDSPIGHDRLVAYPTAKRCRPCQEIREKTRGATHR